MLVVFSSQWFHLCLIRFSICIIFDVCDNRIMQIFSELSKYKGVVSKNKG